MIDALIGGKISGTPIEHTGQGGTQFDTAKVRVPCPDGTANITSVIAFDASVCSQLLALDDGDSVGIAGTLEPKAWTDRSGEARPALSLVEHALLSTYHVSRKRHAVVSSTNLEE